MCNVQGKFEGNLFHSSICAVKCVSNFAILFKIYNQDWEIDGLMRRSSFTRSQSPELFRENIGSILVRQKHAISLEIRTKCD